MSGHQFDHAGFDHMLDDFYRYRGWDLATGIPMRQTLESLGLEDVADDLEKRGLIAA